MVKYRKRNYFFATPHRRAVNFISKETSKIVQTASHAGFCYGVRRAVETSKKIKLDNPNKKVYILGELIHNSFVIKELEELGILTVEKLPEPAPEGAYCIIRSHGASIDEIERIKNLGYEVIDLTCPDVKKVQEKAVELVLDGYFLIILGKKEHPEVAAIEANAKKYAKNAADIVVIKNFSDLVSSENLFINKKKIGVVIQTTQRIEFLKEAASFLSDKTKELKILNTICNSTNLRQTEAKKLASEFPLVVVAGSKKSANTTHLADILSEITTTLHIEDENELELHNDLIKKFNKIGITAGASTPDYIIKQIETKLKNTERT